MEWPQMQTGKPVPADQACTGSSGIGLIRPLEASARKLGVDILLKHRMTALVREKQNSGRVLGISVAAGGKTFDIREKKGVVIATAR